MKINLLKLIIVGAFLYLVLLGSMVAIMKRNANLRDLLESVKDSFVTELTGMKTRTSKNGSQIASVQTQMVTKDMMRGLETRLSKRLEDMDIKFDKKITDVVMYNTVTTYNVKDTMVLVTDTSYITRFVDRPWIDLYHEVIPKEGYSKTNLTLYDSVMLVGTWNYDKDYWWPKRLWKPKITEITLNNLNPYSKVSYLRQYKLTKKWGGE